MTYYINRSGDGHLETVDEFDSRKEADEMVLEYRMSSPTARHYVSRRACANWKWKDDE